MYIRSSALGHPRVERLKSNSNICQSPWRVTTNDEMTFSFHQTIRIAIANNCKRMHDRSRARGLISKSDKTNRNSYDLNWHRTEQRREIISKTIDSNRRKSYHVLCHQICHVRTVLFVLWLCHKWNWWRECVCVCGRFRANCTHNTYTLRQMMCNVPNQSVPRTDR